MPEGASHTTGTGTDATMAITMMGTAVMTITGATTATAIRMLGIGVSSHCFELSGSLCSAGIGSCLVPLLCA